jgi:hypothetical protein
MAKQDPSAERAERLVEALRRQREGEDYPLTVARLKELADSQASDEEVFKALTRKPFVEQVLVAAKKDLESPLALAEDAGRLATSALLLEFALGKLCSSEKPLHPPAKVATQVDKGLRTAFLADLERRASAGDWPEGVGTRAVKGKVQLYLKKFPPPPEPRSPAVELAEKLVRALEERRGQGPEAYPLTLAELQALADPEGGALLKKAVTQEPFRSRVVETMPGKPANSFVALAEDRTTLAECDKLLLSLLGKSTSRKQPSIPPERLGAALPEELRGAFVEALRRRAEGGSLPAGVGARTENGELQVYLKENVPEHLVLREKLFAALRAGRERGEDYPTTLAQLAERVAPGTPAELLGKVASDKALKGQLVFAVAGSAESPVALAGDEERLAASDLLAEFAVGLLSTAEKPLHPPAKVVGKLDKGIRGAFEPVLARRIEANDLPAAVVAELVKGTPHLRLKRYLPPPPPRDPAEVLAERLLAALQARRSAGDYPIPLLKLTAQADANAPEKVVKKALAAPAFRGSALVVPVPGGEPLVALGEDKARVAEDPRLLEAVLTATRSADNQAIPAGGLARKVAKELQGPFAEALERKVNAGALPAGIGCLRIGKKPYLFLVADVGAPVPVRAQAPPVPARPQAATPAGGPVDFARLFDEAFARLDRARGSHNHVSLVYLRQEVPVDRPTFDRELHELRRAGQYSLQGAEGRQGLSAEEREAGIVEDGSLLLFVSKKMG